MPDPTTLIESPADPEQSASDRQGARAVPDDVVRQVADRVYAMLAQDLAIERERQRPSLMCGRGDWSV